MLRIATTKYDVSDIKEFTYDALDLSFDKFRLIRVLPELQHGCISCELTHASTSVPYRALSYTWGPRSGQENILINGKSLRIRRNLWNFLRVARQEYSQVWFWIDAICIDQNNVLERNHHVRQMAKIYRRSLETIVWLHDHSSVGSKFRQSQTCIEDKIVLLDLQAEAARFKSDFWQLQTEVSQASFQNEKFLIFIVLVLDRVFRNPYWNRLWIVQEVLLSPRKHVVTPNFRIDWDFLETIHNFGTRFCFDNTPWYFAWLLSRSRCKYPEFRKSRACYQKIRSKVGVTQLVERWAPKYAEAMKAWKVNSKCSVAFEQLENLESICLDGPAFHLVSQMPITEDHDPSVIAASRKEDSQIIHEEHLVKFMELLQSFTYTDCSDIRDKIYGLLALSPFLGIFHIDYNMNIYDLYFVTYAFFDPLTEGLSRWSNSSRITGQLLRQLHIGILDLVFGDPKHRSKFKIITRLGAPQRDLDRSVVLYFGRAINLDNAYIACAICETCGQRVCFSARQPLRYGVAVLQCLLGRSSKESTKHVLFALAWRPTEQEDDLIIRAIPFSYQGQASSPRDEPSAWSWDWLRQPSQDVWDWSPAPTTSICPKQRFSDLVRLHQSFLGDLSWSLTDTRFFTDEILDDLYLEQSARTNLIKQLISWHRYHPTASNEE